MAVLTQLIMNGLIAGSIYALMAAGFSLMFGIQRFMNIAHGSTYAIGAYCAYAISTIAPLWVGILAGIGAAMLLGTVINTTLYQPLAKKQNSNALLLTSFGAFLLIEAGILIIFGADLRAFDTPVASGLSIFGAVATPLQLIIICAAPVIFILLWLFLNKTKTGKVLRATADSETIARTMGINTRRMITITTLIGSGLAGIAGILVALEQNIEYNMGLGAVLKGLTAAVIGGIGNVSAAILGGFLLGLAENFGVWFIPVGYKDAVGFGILIIFLLFRPQGFFGIKKREEVGG